MLLAGEAATPAHLRRHVASTCVVGGGAVDLPHGERRDNLLGIFQAEVAALHVGAAPIDHTRLAQVSLPGNGHCFLLLLLLPPQPLKLLLLLLSLRL